MYTNKLNRKQNAVCMIFLFGGHPVLSYVSKVSRFFLDFLIVFQILLVQVPK